MSSASAQLIAAKDGPIVYGHHHLNTTNTETARKFWIDALGGVLVKFGTNNTEIIKFPNALLFMRAANMPAPSGGSKGTTVDHIAFSVTNLRQTLDRIKAGGFRIVTTAEAPPNVKVVDDIGVVTGGPVSGIAYVMAPDDMKVELLEMKAQTAPVASHHLHFAGMNKEMQAWYMQTFGAKEQASANPAAFVSATLPGLIDELHAGGGGGGHRGARDRSHRVRGEEPRGVHQAARSQRHQARASRTGRCRPSASPSPSSPTRGARASS